MVNEPSISWWYRFVSVSGFSLGCRPTLAVAGDCNCLRLRCGRQLKALEIRPRGLGASLLLPPPVVVVVVVVVGGRLGGCPGAAGAETIGLAVPFGNSPAEEDVDDMDLREMKRFQCSFMAIVVGLFAM